MQITEFLQRILPDEGDYCFTTIYGEAATAKVRNHFYSNLADIPEQAKAHSQANLYYACASYTDKRDDKGKRQRTHDAVSRIRALWLDVDVRLDKGDACYKSFEEAGAGLAKFLSDSKLPIPLVVHTGGGLHLYWPLVHSLTREEWQPWADKLKIYTAKMRFKADPGITADSARIMRLPETVNHKWGKESKVLNDAGPYELSAFGILQFQVKDRKAEAKKEVQAFAKVHAAPIFKGCAQMAAFEGGAFQTGEQWIACGRLLAQTHEGEELWFKYSALDARYNEAEATKKWEDSLTFDKPTLCARFESLNPSLCEGCKFKGKINTPVQIARDKYLGPPVAEDIAKRLAEVEMPSGFSFDQSGAVVIREGKDEEDIKVHKVATFPFYLKDRSTSEMYRDTKAIIIEAWNDQDGWSEYDVNMGELLTNVTVGLGRLGIMVGDPRLAGKYLRDSYDLLAKKKKQVKVYDTFGWKGDKFLWGDRLYGWEDGNLAVRVVHLGSEARAIAEHLRPGGRHGDGAFTLEGLRGWQRASQGLFAAGHEWQAITLLAGAGAPLLGLLPDTEGGTIYSTYDPVGGKGKSTATLAGATIWGSYEGLSTTASDTINARMAKLGTLKHLPFAYDEMKRDNPGIAKQFVQTFTAGTERARMDRNATVSRTPRTWRTIMLTSANSELVGAISADDGSEAMSDRVFEVHAEGLPLKKGEINNSLKNEFITNCGFAGLPILGCILKDLDKVRADIRAKEIKYMDEFFDPKLRFRAQFIAVIDVIGHLIADNGLLVFDPQYYVDWLLSSVSSQQAFTRQISPAELLARYLRENTNSTIVATEFTPGTAKRIVAETKSGVVKVRIESDTHHIMIPKRDLVNWLQEKDQSISAFVKTLEDSGVLLGKAMKKNLGAGTQYSSGQEYCLVFNGAHEEITGFNNVIPLEAPLKKPASSPRLSTLSR